MLDFNKDVMSYLEGAEADYLILDLGTLFAKAVLKIRSRQSPEHYTYITNAQAIKENPGFLENPFFEVVDTMYFSDYYEMMMSYIPRYTELLKSHYPTEKMIIIEVPVTERYIDADGTLKASRPVLTLWRTRWNRPIGFLRSFCRVHTLSNSSAQKYSATKGISGDCIVCTTSLNITSICLMLSGLYAVI